MATPTLSGSPTATSSTSTATCVTATPGKYGRVPPDSCNSYYEFDPSFGGNVAFAALFGLSAMIHLVQAIAFKKVRSQNNQVHGYHARHSGTLKVMLTWVKAILLGSINGRYMGDWSVCH